MSAFWRPRQRSNGINSAAVYAGISLPLQKPKGELCGRINKEKIITTIEKVFIYPDAY